MNETERRKLWFEARAALRLGGDYPDWPDRLALPVIARLHDPVASRGLLGFLEAAADAGTLRTETHEFQTARPGRRAATSAHLTGRSVVIAQPPIIETQRLRNAHAADVAALFGASDVGRFLAAWIAPHRTPTEAHQTESPTPKRGRKPGEAQPRLVEILDALQEYARMTRQDFDRQAMPGPLGENFHEEGSLHWLCASIDPVFKKAKTTFEKYRAGLCAVQPYATPTDFYRRALALIAPKLKVAQNVHHLPIRIRKKA